MELKIALVKKDNNQVDCYKLKNSEYVYQGFFVNSTAAFDYVRCYVNQYKLIFDKKENIYICGQLLKSETYVFSDALNFKN